ncbi:adenosine deaminase [Colletotrichum chrysophilum]|uniref:Adenosine deaminase n=1 Tax=Colletotrichum chrysophilum TaxID=1836956 RepID=A0AAD9A0Z7_9PEZI|nr:adenosine deaminase [Colletotrichum chrysophilum]
MQGWPESGCFDLCKSALNPFLAELPQREHHLYFEGCLTPALVFTLSAKNKVPLPSPADDPSYEYPEWPSKRYEHFDNLDDFL